MGNTLSVKTGNKAGRTTATPTVLQVREYYRHFRILVIGRANAGKTTLLSRVCNTAEEPCIYDEKKKNLLEPTEGRGTHDVRRAFGFKSNPGFIFHDSPGFEAGGDRELREVQSFIAERAKAIEPAEQLHAIWFCFTPDLSRPLLELEQKFFNEARGRNVPVVAIFTKFDDLVTQVYEPDLEDEENYQIAERELQDKFQLPLSQFKFPPRAYVRMEDMNDDDSGHQNQVKGLMNATAGSLNNQALEMLFVSVQQNNLELSVRYAVQRMEFAGNLSFFIMESLRWFSHTYGLVRFERIYEDTNPEH